MGESRHMRCSGGCGLSWLCSADTEHTCDDHIEAVVADGECVLLPCKVQSGSDVSAGSRVSDVRLEGGGATLLMCTRKEDIFTGRPPLLVVSKLSHTYYYFLFYGQKEDYLFYLHCSSEFHVPSTEKA